MFYIAFLIACAISISLFGIVFELKIYQSFFYFTWETIPKTVLGVASNLWHDPPKLICLIFFAFGLCLYAVPMMMIYAIGCLVLPFVVVGVSFNVVMNTLAWIRIRIGKRLGVYPEWYSDKWSGAGQWFD